MPVKDVYGKKVSEQNHMILAHNPTSMLLNEFKRKKMGDGRTEIYREIFKTNPVKQEETQLLFGKDIRKMPNQKWHQIVSFIKSGVRILGYLLIPFSLPWAAGILVFSEIIGIIEELV